MERNKLTDDLSLISMDEFKLRVLVYLFLKCVQKNGKRFEL